MNINRTLLVSFSAPFGDKELLPINRLDRNRVARVLSGLNHKVRNGEMSNIFDLFSFWFNKDNDQAVGFFDSIMAYYKTIGYDSSRLTVINLWSNFNLLNKLLSSSYEETSEISKNEFEITLFLNYLKVNDEFIEKSDIFSKELDSKDFPRIEDYISRLHLVGTLPYYEISYTNVLFTLISNFYKSYLLFSFFESDYPELISVFFEDYQLNNKEEFFRAILPVAFHAMDGETTGSGIQILELDSEESKAFLDLLIANTETSINLAEDFVHLRANPLMKLDDGEYLIFDRGLAVNRIFNSIFFDILKIIKDKRVKIKGNFFGVYTYEFIEKYLSCKVLDKIFAGRGYKVLSGNSITEQFNVDTEPDYYVRNGKKISIFEIKASIIRGDVKQSFKWKDIEGELRKKFFEDEKEDKKAIKQLIERIENLASNNDKAIYDNARHDKFIVTPILLITDHSLNAVGVNHILNEWFNLEINNSQILKPIKERIGNLIVINIDTLIIYSEYFKESAGAFERLIESYQHRVNPHRIASLKNKQFATSEMQMEALEQRINDTLVSFATHCEETIGTPKLIKEFMVFAKDLFK